MQRLLSSNKGKNEKKRRFNDDQIRLLETMFQTQTKLEPKQKLELARELGLQPRQVSIWFQNKRARWKSKQLEKEYSTLKSNYDGLLKSVDSLKKENQFLTNQVYMIFLFLAFIFYVCISVYIIYVMIWFHLTCLIVFYIVVREAKREVWAAIR